MCGDQAPKPVIRVLALDGGGMRGLFSLYALREMKRRLVAAGEPCTDSYWSTHFDIIIGTSTGGIIAAGLAFNKPLDALIGFYESKCGSIFAQERYAPLLQPRHNPFTPAGLRSQLVDLFQDAPVQEASTRLMLPTFDLASRSTLIFETPGFYSDVAAHKTKSHNQVPVVDALLSTTAAPTYFPIKQSSALVDGGLWANNPATTGVVEALKVAKHLPLDSYDLQVLSIGTTSYLPPPSPLSAPVVGGSVLAQLTDVWDRPVPLPPPEVLIQPIFDLLGLGPFARLIALPFVRSSFRRAIAKSRQVPGWVSPQGEGLQVPPSSGVSWLVKLIPVLMAAQSASTSYWMKQLGSSKVIDYCRVDGVTSRPYTLNETNVALLGELRPLAEFAVGSAWTDGEASREGEHPLGAILMETPPRQRAIDPYR